MPKTIRIYVCVYILCMCIHCKFLDEFLVHVVCRNVSSSHSKFNKRSMRNFRTKRDKQQLTPTAGEKKIKINAAHLNDNHPSNELANDGAHFD